jgi:hypothetical protein
VILTACAAFFNLTLMSLIRSHAFSAEVSEAAIATTIQDYRRELIVYAGVTLLALISPIASFARLRGREQVEATATIYSSMSTNDSVAGCWGS